MNASAIKTSAPVIVSIDEAKTSLSRLVKRAAAWKKMTRYMQCVLKLAGNIEKDKTMT
jgi:hypothetical protein